MILPSVVCPPIQAPQFGFVNCDDDGEFNTGDTCIFSCQDGFELGKTVTRTCNEDGNWAPFLEAECVIGM